MDFWVLCGELGQEAERLFGDFPACQLYVLYYWVGEGTRRTWTAAVPEEDDDCGLVVPEAQLL